MSKSPIDQIQPFLPGQRSIPAADLNAIVDFLKKLHYGGPSLGGISDGMVGSDGTNILNHSEISEIWIGKTYATGKTPYTDERYWVIRQYCSNSAGNKDAEMTFASYGSGDYRYRHVTATNLGESVDSTHRLTQGVFIIVFETFDRQNPSIKHYYFWAAPTEIAPFLVKVYQTGGSAGSYSSTCTWRYDVKKLDGSTVLGSAVYVKQKRIPNCVYTKAADGTYGLAAYDGATLVLLSAYGEYPTTETQNLVYDVDYNTGAHTFTYDAYPVRVLSKGSADDGTSVTSLTECDDS